MKKGINSWCLPPSLTLDEIFQVAKSAGFEAIELNMTENQQNQNLVDELGLKANAILTIESTFEELKKIKEASVRYDLPISSIASGLHWTYSLNHSDRAIREKGKIIVCKMIDACAYLGGDCVLVVPGVVTNENDYESCYNLAKEALVELADYAESKKIIIGVENVWNKFLLSPLEMRQFIDEINHPNVLVYFDAGNVLQFGYPEQWVRVLGHRIAKVHIKDFRRDIGNINGFTNLLNGDLDWLELMKSLREVGYDKEVICELAPYRTNPVQLAHDASAAMNDILK